MTEAPPRFLRLIRYFDASPDRVFEAWSNPNLATKWLFSLGVGERLVTQLSTRVGDTWTITDRRGGIDYTAVGEYLVIEPPHRLVFTFAMPQFSPNHDRITVELAPEGMGCLLTFTQEGVDIAAELEQLPEGVEGGSEEGWKQMFDRLAAALG
jgi:uncharacterized protein YndB with AHSA1/START domain